jgi:hypothetical protein
MSEEKKVTLEVPEMFRDFLEDLRLLKHHEGNPNRMTIKQKDRLWFSLQKFGWLIPIIADKAGVIADGEQRVDVCLSHGEFFGPVLRRPLTEAERLYIGQDLNKLRGKHNRKEDEVEYFKMIDLGMRNDLEALLLAVGERLPEDLGGPKESLGMVPDAYQMLVLGKDGKAFDESQRKIAYEKLQSMGYMLRTLDI